MGGQERKKQAMAAVVTPGYRPPLLPKPIMRRNVSEVAHPFPNKRCLAPELAHAIPMETYDPEHGFTFFPWRLIPLTLVLILAFCMPICSGVQPMICHVSSAKQIYSIPKSISCNAPKRSEGELEEARVEMFKRNLLQYKSEAWVCRKVQRMRNTLTYFFADEHLLQDSKENVGISGEECTRMRKWKSCEAGPLKQKGDLWETENAIDLSYPSGGTSCCYWKKVATNNCYLYSGFVYKRHGEKQMESTVGDVSHCDYKQGMCQLKDKTFVIWEPNENEHCKFMKWKEFSGQKIGNNWISEDGNLALTHNSRDWVSDCENHQLRMSDQGIPFRYLSTNTVFNKHRLKRQNYHQTGVVTTEMLASSLQALEFDLRNLVQFSFSHALASTCRSMESVVSVLRASIFGNPTLALRELLHKTNIWARAGGDVIEVWPCEYLMPGSFQFRAMNGSCTEFVPIEFQAKTVTAEGYLDPKTNIIHHTSVPTHCSFPEIAPEHLWPTKSVWSDFKHTHSVETVPDSSN